MDAAGAEHAGRGGILASRLVSEIATGSGLHFVDAGRLALDDLEGPLALVEATSEQHLEPACRSRTPAAAEPSALTARENEVVALIADGKSNDALAIELSHSEHTVKRQVANILTKLDLHETGDDHRRVRLPRVQPGSPCLVTTHRLVRV